MATHKNLEGLPHREGQLSARIAIAQTNLKILNACSFKDQQQQQELSDFFSDILVVLKAEFSQVTRLQQLIKNSTSPMPEALQDMIQEWRQVLRQNDTFWEEARRLFHFDMTPDNFDLFPLGELSQDVDDSLDRALLALGGGGRKGRSRRTVRSKNTPGKRRRSKSEPMIIPEGAESIF